jgi:hypothetical protein
VVTEDKDVAPVTPNVPPTIVFPVVVTEAAVMAPVVDIDPAFTILAFNVLMVS